MNILLSQLSGSKSNPRKVKAGREAHQRLVASIKSHGLIEPLVVQKTGEESYTVIAGHRRLAALREVHRGEDAKVPCIVRSVDDPDEVLSLSLAENFVREAMHPLDEAVCFATLAREQGQEAGEIARSFGVSETYVRQRMKLAGLCPPVKKALRENRVTLAVAEAFCAVPVERQAKLWAELSGQPRDAKQVRAMIEHDWIDATHALFDVSTLEPSAVSQDLFGGSVLVERSVFMRQQAEGRLYDAFHALDQIGWLVEAPEDEAHKVLAAQYLRAVDDKRTALIVSPTHSEGRKVTDLIRQELRQRGVLKNERLVSTLHRIDLLAAEMTLPNTYRPGWVIEVTKNTDELRKGDRLRVSEVSGRDVMATDRSGTTHHLDVAKLSGHIAVYDPAILPVAEGDRIRITRNGKDLHGRSLHNGTLHTVQGFTTKGDIRLKGGAVLDRDYAHFTAGYVTTSYSAQSKTVDRVFIPETEESFSAANREQIYVSVSRGRRSPFIVTTDKQALFEAVQATSQRMAALDLQWGDASRPLDKTPEKATATEPAAVPTRDDSDQWASRLLGELHIPPPSAGRSQERGRCLSPDVPAT